MYPEDMIIGLTMNRARLGEVLCRSGWRKDTRQEAQMVDVVALGFTKNGLRSMQIHSVIRLRV